MSELLSRLKLYEPIFHRWKVDFIAIEYEDMAWVYLVDERGMDNEYALMKVKTIPCHENDASVCLYNTMMKYDVDSILYKVVLSIY